MISANLVGSERGRASECVLLRALPGAFFFHGLSRLGGCVAGKEIAHKGQERAFGGLDLMIDREAPRSGAHDWRTSRLACI